MRSTTARNINNKKKGLSPEQSEQLLRAWKDRFEKNMNRHKGLEWAEIQAKLEANTEKLWSLHEMERTGGEPDVVGHDKKTGEYIFCDCSAESPKVRRSVCYDREELEAWYEHKHKDKETARLCVNLIACQFCSVMSEVCRYEFWMILNFYSVLNAFLALVRLLFGVLVIVFGIRAWWIGRKPLAPESRKALEDRG